MFYKIGLNENLVTLLTKLGIVETVAEFHQLSMKDRIRLLDTDDAISSLAILSKVVDIYLPFSAILLHASVKSLYEYSHFPCIEPSLLESPLIFSDFILIVSLGELINEGKIDDASIEIYLKRNHIIGKNLYNTLDSKEKMTLEDKLNYYLDGRIELSFLEKMGEDDRREFRKIFTPHLLCHFQLNI